MKFITKTAIFLTGFAIVMAPTAAFAQLSGGGSSAATTLSGGGSSATTASDAPALSGGGSSSSQSSAPSLSGGGSSASGSGAPALSGGGSSATTADTGSNNNGGSTNTGGGTTINLGSGGGSTGGHSSSGSVPNYRPITSCQPITGSLKAGDTGTEVTMLQTFLKNTEGMNVAITGVYDAQTVEAVKAFQVKYAAQVLAPWGITAPTGIVYITTAKVINSRMCAIPLTLTNVELAILEAYKARPAGSISNEVVGVVTQPSGSVSGHGTATDSLTVVTPTSTDHTQVAAAGQSAWKSFWTKVWNFIKRIFGR